MLTAHLNLPPCSLQGYMDRACEAMIRQASGGTFYSQRVYDLFPQMATANSGWDTHNANASNVFGSEVIGDGSNDSDYIEWTVNVPAGNYKVTVLHQTATNSGIAALSVNGGATIDSLDHYSSPAVINVKWTSAQFALTEGQNTIRFTKNGKNASSSQYFMRFQHVQLIKQDAGSALVSPSNMPSMHNVSVLFADSHTNWNTVSINTSQAFGSRMVSTGAQNAARTLSFWAPAGNFTLALHHRTSSANGIYSVTVDGNSIGTIDGYAAVAVNNALDTTLTGTLATTGIHTITFTMATKNASSTNYTGDIQHIQIRMTSITETLSQDLAPEVALLWPTFNESAGDFTLTISNTYAHYYAYLNADTLDDEITLTSNCVLRPGTYRLDMIGTRATNAGKLHLYEGGASLGSADFYGASLANHIASGTGLALTGYGPHTFKIVVADKNASSSGYLGRFTLARLVRTGV